MYFHLERLESRRVLDATFEFADQIAGYVVEQPKAIAVGDIDGDQLPDIVVADGARYWSTVRWMKNTGNALFSNPIEIAPGTAGTTGLSIGDIDGDGDNDIVASVWYADHKVVWYENTDGRGSFAEERVISQAEQNPVGVFVDDIDSNGRYDVLTAAHSHVYVHFSTEQGWDSIQIRPFGAWNVVSGNLNGDGMPDVFLNGIRETAEGLRSVEAYRNEGGRTLSSHIESGLVGGATYLSLADITGNGFDDIVVSKDDGKLIWLENTTSDSFAEHSISLLQAGEPPLVATGDFNGDSRPDIVTAKPNANGKITLHRNNGDKTFEPSFIDTDSGAVAELLTTDLDADGDLDFVVSLMDDSVISWYENDGTGEFRGPAHIAASSLWPNALADSDIDGDGDLDLISTSLLDRKVAWYENVDGLGTFGPQRRIASAVDWPRAIKAGDLDGDGDDDVVVASQYDESIAWYENLDSLGTFGPKQILSDDFAGISLDLGDIDLDGDLDIGFAVHSVLDGHVGWFINEDGLGHFTRQIIQGTAKGVNEIRLADKDGDGDEDFLLTRDFRSAGGDEISTILWLENTDGNGAFTEGLLVSSAFAQPDAITVADIDSDGDLDVLAGSQTTGLVVWFENENNGTSFNNFHAITDNAVSITDLVVADFDRDGDSDVAYSTADRDVVAWLENEDGRGVFARENTIAEVEIPTSLLPADFDADGDLDLAITAISRQRFDWANNGIVWFRNIAREDLVGDFDGNGMIGPNDLDLLCSEIRERESGSRFDLDNNGVVDHADGKMFLEDIAEKTIGDVNFDGFFNSRDLVILFQNSEYEDDVLQNSRWTEGDWNCDGDFNSTDLVLAFQSGAYSRGNASRSS